MASTAKVLSSLEAARAVPSTAPVRLAPARKAPRERAGSGLELVRDSLGGARSWHAGRPATRLDLAGPPRPRRRYSPSSSVAAD